MDRIARNEMIIWSTRGICKMKKLLLVTTALGVSLASAQADIITLTATGYLSAGYDYAGTCW